jgi:excinuclease ABC subunit C
LQQARDEAHRTAVTYNRKRRTIRTVTSELLKIPGVGPVKRRALLTAFGSIQGVRAATPDQIAALPGWSAGAAEKLVEALKQSDPVAPTPDAGADTSRDPRLVSPDTAAIQSQDSHLPSDQ